MKDRSKVKFILSPSYMISENDGQEHWVGARELARLYGVDLSECVVCRDRPIGGNHNLITNDDLYELEREFPNAMLLTPQYHYEDYIRISRKIMAKHSDR